MFMQWDEKERRREYDEMVQDLQDLEREAREIVRRERETRR
jgi:hypothetical protein